MPESNDSGQCDPVTEDPLSQRHEAAAASALAITPSPQITRNQYQNHRQSSIGMVPVSATSRTLNTANQLPPSPPSSISHSPPDHIEWPTENVKEGIQSDELPDTPEASPSTISLADASLRQKLSLSSREFAKKVLPNILTINEKGEGKFANQNGHYIVEDAGMEIVSQGCMGAVLIDTKPTYMPSNESALAFSFSPGTPRIRSGTSSSRMSRSSSLNSNSSSFVERTMPRRTLLTQIRKNDKGSEMNAKDLRSHTLDILDHATEKLHVDNIIFVLDRSNLDEEEFRATVHGLCYVGASIIGHGLYDKEVSEKTPATSNLIKGGDPNESIHSPRCVGRNLVLLSVDV